MGSVSDYSRQNTLTPREWEILALLAEGLTNPEIAMRLTITRETVKSHVSNILSKLGVKSRHQARDWARENWNGRHAA